MVTQLGFYFVNNLCHSQKCNEGINRLHIYFDLKLASTNIGPGQWTMCVHTVLPVNKSTFTRRKGVWSETGLSALSSDFCSYFPDSIFIFQPLYSFIL